MANKSTRKDHIIHGMCIGGKINHLYWVWSAMKDRCKNTSNKSYKNYGGRGITYCDTWERFENFYADMGDRPTPKHSLDRIDNNGSYNKLNCQWVTGNKQNNNKRNAKRYFYKGKERSIVELSKIYNISKSTLWTRINELKLTIDDAIEKPSRYSKTRKKS